MYNVYAFIYIMNIQFKYECKQFLVVIIKSKKYYINKVYFSADTTTSGFGYTRPS